MLVHPHETDISSDVIKVERNLLCNEDDEFLRSNVLTA